MEKLENIIDSRKCQSIDDFYDTVANVLRFPGHFGRNLDALRDCLSDLKEDAKIVLANFDFFLIEESEKTRNKVIDVFQELAMERGVNVIVQ
ncbi:barstar family protein [Chitinophaga lutea]